MALQYVTLDIMKHRNPMNGYYALRWKILERDNFTCQCCGQKAPNIALEVDHIIPVSEGGTDDEPNLRASCYACNRGRNGLAIMKQMRKTPRPVLPSQPKVRHTLMADKVLEVVLPYPQGITPLELAEKLNIQSGYARLILHRLWHTQKVDRTSKGVYKIYQKESIT